MGVPMTDVCWCLTENTKFCNYSSVKNKLAKKHKKTNSVLWTFVSWNENTCCVSPIKTSVMGTLTHWSKSPLLRQHRNQFSQREKQLSTNRLDDVSLSGSYLGLKVCSSCGFLLDNRDQIHLDLCLITTYCFPFSLTLCHYSLTSRSDNGTPKPVFPSVFTFQSSAHLQFLMHTVDHAHSPAKIVKFPHRPRQVCAQDHLSCVWVIYFFMATSPVDWTELQIN